MVDNQHRQITGYRELSQEDIDKMNGLKADEAKIMYQLDDDLNHATVRGYNARSLALAKTNLQQAYMWYIRAIARPNGE